MRKFEYDDGEKDRFTGTSGCLTFVVMALVFLAVCPLMSLIPFFKDLTVPVFIAVVVSILSGIFAFDLIRKLLLKIADMSAKNKK